MVAAMDTRTTGVVSPIGCPAGDAKGATDSLGVPDSVFVVVLIDAYRLDCVVVPPGLVNTTPETSQSPAVRLIEVTLTDVLLVSVTAEPMAMLLETYSPTLPAVALSLVTVPLSPAAVVQGHTSFTPSVNICMAVLAFTP